MVQGSRQDLVYITSEQHTEGKVGCAGFAPDTTHMSADANRNKSGTAEVNYTFVSYYQEAKVFFLSCRSRIRKK